MNCSIKFTVTCPHKHDFKTNITNWLYGNHRCPQCSRAKANLKLFGHNKLYLYWIKIYDWINGKWCYKFGITSHKDIKGRFNIVRERWGFKFEIIDRTEASKEQVCQMEVDLLYEVRNYRAEWVPPEFGGYTECFVCSEAFARNIWNKVTLGW